MNKASAAYAMLAATVLGTSAGLGVPMPYLLRKPKKQKYPPLDIEPRYDVQAAQAAMKAQAKRKPKRKRK